MVETLQTILATVGAFALSGVTLTGIAYWIFKTFSEKWLNNKFAERLEAFKHAQQKELEEQKFNISKLLDRTTKLHAREFEVLPTAWAMLNDANAHAMTVLASLQSYPDFDRWTQAQQDEFIENSDLKKSQKEEFAKSKDKSRFYREHVEWRQLQEAKRVYREFNFFLLKSGIFLPDELYARFDEVGKGMWSALIDHETGLRHPSSSRPSTEDLRRFLKEGQESLKDLKSRVHARLWSKDNL